VLAIVMNDKPSIEDAATQPNDCAASRPACPACGGRLIEIRGKLQCSRCHTICETCCEGGPE
jgi:hypothetical protein